MFLVRWAEPILHKISVFYTKVFLLFKTLFCFYGREKNFYGQIWLYTIISLLKIVQYIYRKIELND